MASQVTRRQMRSWLLTHGFTESAGKGSHRKFTHGATGTVITMMGHGPQDLTKKHAGLTIRTLASLGFSRETVLRELSGRK